MRICIEDTDNKGIWISKNKNVGLGHNRLSIIDINQRSNQPMFSEDNNYIISFNGEIYNFKELITFLSRFKIKFRTKSDTEVILKLWPIKRSKNAKYVERNVFNCYLG